MKFNLKERCHDSRKKEFFYGTKVNPNIQDAYLGLCYLDPNERKRIIGPGRGHEEILLIMNGKVELLLKKENLQLAEGEAFHIPNGKKLRLNNLTDEKIYFVIAGGHTKHHHH